MFFPALLAKFLSAGAVAQAASGAGIALVAFTGAGVVGVLPGPVQDTFSSVVGSQTASDETVVPSDTSDTTDTSGTSGTELESPAVVSPEAPATTELTLEDWEKGPKPDQAFGDWVSSGARLGYVDGATVSKYAHERNDQRKAGATTAPVATPEDDSADDSSGDASDDSQTVETESGDHGSSGHGNSGRGHN